ncbi:LysR substrate-binding domain-containing protein [Bradyrhizobium sp.]|uniref:LysR family transcriptional regulator n=1 Tax=Bradyrhizobium sp. TaxID=376 RepID=UPI003C59A557
MTAPALAPSDLQDMIFFVEVARALNFTRASRASGIPIATLSRRVAAMEKRVGVRLLQRTTRRLALTEPGKRYLDRCERILQDAAAAHEVLKEAAERLSGHLRLSMPVEFGMSLVAPIIDEFSRLYPDITFEADLTPRPANFVDENIDLSIRLGEVGDSSLIVRRLGTAARLFYASPSYLAKYGEPAHPKDLARHECILQSYMAEPGVWRVVSGKRSIDVNVHGRFSTNNISMTLKFAEQGHGIAALSPPHVRPSFDCGSVRQILADWSLPPMPVHAVMTSRLVPARVRVFLGFLANRLTVI